MARAGLIAGLADGRPLASGESVDPSSGKISARVFLERAAVPLLLGSIAVALVAIPGIPPLCPMRRILHVPCPSCGLTRAARLAITGQWGEATRTHPLWFVVLPYVGLVGAAECVTFVRDGVWGRWAGRRAVKRVGWGIAAALVGVWIAREMGAWGGPVAI